MIIGGPFTFLAGLFSLGAAGADKAVSKAKFALINEAYEKDMATHRYIPSEIQQKFESCMNYAVQTITLPGEPPLYINNIGRHDCFGGIDMNSVMNDIEEQYNEYITPTVHLRQLAICAVACYFVNQFGYDYNLSKSIYGSGLYFDVNKAATEIVPRHLKYTIEDFTDMTYEDKVKGKHKSLFHNVCDPYRIVYDLQKKGIATDIVLPVTFLDFLKEEEQHIKEQRRKIRELNQIRLERQIDNLRYKKGDNNE